MTDKIYLNDEQWEFLKREEEKRIEEIKRHNEIVQSALLDAVSLMSKSDGIINKRDYFAAKAMASIIAKTPFQTLPDDYTPYDKTAIVAYDYADAMIAAMDK